MTTTTYVTSTFLHQRTGFVPVSIDKTGIDIVRALYSSDRLQTYPCGFIWHNINKAIFKFITWKIGTDKS